MSTDQAAVAAEPADRALAGIAMFTVPDHLAPSGPARPAGTVGPQSARSARSGRPEGGAGTGPAPAAGRAAGAGSGLTAPERPWAQQFAVLLAEALAGVRPPRQVLPWLSKRGSAQLHRLMPLFSGEHRPRVARVLTAMPSHDVVEMTMVVMIGPRARALAVRLERRAAEPARAAAARPGAAPVPRWLCTDIEAG